MTTLSSNPKQRQKLREALDQVNAFTLPDHIQTALDNHASNATLDPALIQRYKDLRATFIQRNIQNAYLTYINSYSIEDDEFDETPTMPSLEDQESLEQQMEEVKRQVGEASQEIHRQVTELQQKHETFLSRREELRRIVQDMDGTDDTTTTNSNNNHPDDDKKMEEEEEEDSDIEDEALVQEEKRLAALQERKAQLEAKLQQLQNETISLRVSCEETEAKVAEFTNGKTPGAVAQQQLPESPAHLQDEMTQMQAKLQEQGEIKEFYDGLREVMEELTGIQLLQVVPLETTAREGSVANNSTHCDEEISAGSNPKCLYPGYVLYLKVLQDHELRITLKPTKEDPEIPRVVAAKITTNTIVRQQVDRTRPENDGNEKTTTSDDQNSDQMEVKLTIPELDDLVGLCARFPPGEELRFLVRETMHRIRMIQNRVVELAILHNNVLTKLGKFHHSDGFGTQEQEVICSLPECITVVLRMTADCPVLPGSVYIHKMVGMAGWDEATVDGIKERVSQQEFQSPWALIQQVQAEISRLQTEEGYTLPKTPILPIRRKKE